MNEQPKLWPRYLRAVIIPFACSSNFCLFFFLYLYGQENALIDALQITGLITILISGFLLISNFGAFDMIVFGISRLFARLLPWRNVNMKQTYYDYVANKEENRRNHLILWPSFCFGILYILVSFLFY